MKGVEEIMPWSCLNGTLKRDLRTRMENLLQSLEMMRIGYRTNKTGLS